MKFSSLIGVVDGNTHLNIFVNGQNSACVDANYAKQAVKAGDKRGQMNVNCIEPTVFHHYSGNAIPELNIYLVG